MGNSDRTVWPAAGCDILDTPNLWSIEPGPWGSEVPTSPKLEQTRALHAVVQLAKAAEEAAKRDAREAHAELERLQREAEAAREDARIAREQARASLKATREIVEALADFYAHHRLNEPSRPSLLDEVLGVPTEPGDVSISALTDEYLAALGSQDDD